MLSKQGQAASALSEEVVYKIEVPANRYDLLCLEGLTLALRTFLGTAAPPNYRAELPTNPIVITQKAETLGVRPFIVGAVLRGVTFTETIYRSFLDLQDKLHQNIGRRRTLVAIGTHDLDTLKPNFTYEALPPPSISFVPLSEQQPFTVDKLFAHYRAINSHLLPYLPITESAPLHPVIFDSARIVLSLPPIINGQHSRITLQTRNVLIEATGTDLTKLHIALNTIVAMFSQYCDVPHTVEQVHIVNSRGEVDVTPQLRREEFVAPVDYINRCIGINMLPKDMILSLQKMSLHASYDDKSKALHVSAPITRTDILHAADIMEDVAIAYGYNRIRKTIPSTFTIARQQLINKHSDLLREVTAQAGWTEVLTWALVAHSDNYASMRRADDGQAVLIANPKTAEFECVRVSLLSGLLKALSSNKGQVSLPLRLFEVGDCVLVDETSEVGAHNERRLAALYCGVTSGFEYVHGLVDRLLQQTGYLFQHDQSNASALAVLSTAAASAATYTLVPSEHPSFFPGRQADIVSGGVVLGRFGVLHPEVLAAFEVPYPVSALELDVRKLIPAAQAKEDTHHVRAVHEHPHSGNAYVH